MHVEGPEHKNNDVHHNSMTVDIVKLFTEKWMKLQNMTDAILNWEIEEGLEFMYKS